MEVNGTRSVCPFHSEQFLSTRGDVMCTFYSPMTSAMLFCAPLSSYTASACSEYFVRCRCALYSLLTTSRPARLRRCTRRRRRKGPQNGHRVLQGMLLQTLSLSQGLAASARTLCKRISEGAKDVLCDNHALDAVSTFDGTTAGFGLGWPFPADRPGLTLLSTQ